MIRNLLKQTLILFAVMIIPGMALGSQGKEFNRTVPFEPGGQLTFNTDRGSVVLTSWDQNKVQIFARISPPEDVDREYARQAVEATRVDVSGDSRSLSIRSNFDDVPRRPHYGGWDKRNPDIHYEIRAPRQLNLRMDVDRSEVKVRGFEGELEIRMDRTPLEASDLMGDLRLRMDRGEIAVRGFVGRLDIETGRTNGRLDDVRLNGDSRLDVDRGEVALELNSEQGLSLHVDIGRRGSFQSDFAITTKTLGEKRFHGTINGGGPVLVVEGDRNTVHLRQR